MQLDPLGPDKGAYIQAKLKIMIGDSGGLVGFLKAYYYFTPQVGSRHDLDLPVENLISSWHDFWTALKARKYTVSHFYLENIARKLIAKVFCT